MAAKKTARRRPAKAPPAEHGFTVVLEQIRHQFRVFGETLQGLEERIDARFDEVDARFDQVDARFEQVDARFDRVEGDIGLLKVAVLDHGRRMGGIEGELRDVHVRLERIEDRLSDRALRPYVEGIVDERLAKR